MRPRFGTALSYRLAGRNPALCLMLGLELKIDHKSR
jgi:hypothetical protein